MDLLGECEFPHVKENRNKVKLLVLEEASMSPQVW